MVRLSIFHDKDINEQVFMVRGDERYARSTSTVMELRDVSLQSEYFLQDIFVNVLRDVGNAGLVVYDNDVPIYTMNTWQSTDTGRVITLPALAYDSEHNLRVKYIGNGQCSPSMSKSETVNITNPYYFDSSLTITVPPIQSEYVTVTLTLSNTESTEWSANQPLEVYYDNTLIDTATTNNQGVATTTVTVGNIGLHELKVVYKGSNHLTNCTETVPISVGRKAEFISYPLVGVHMQDATFKVKLTDFLDNPIANENMVIRSHFNGESYVFGYGQTDSQGLITITGTIDNTKCDGTFSVVAYNIEDTSISNVRIVTVNSLSVDYSAPRLYYNENLIISANIGENIEGVPVRFIQDGTTTEISTNTYGIATKSIRGTGTQRTRQFKVTCGNQESDVTTMSDYLAYLSKVNEDIQKGTYAIPYGSLLNLQSIFRLDSGSQGFALLNFNIGSINFNYSFVIEGIVSSSNISIGIGTYYNLPRDEVRFPVELTARKFTNGTIVVGGYVNYNDRFASYAIYDNNTLIYSGDTTKVTVPSVSFKNNSANTQQVTFKRAYSQQTE